MIETPKVVIEETKTEEPVTTAKKFRTPATATFFQPLKRSVAETPKVEKKGAEQHTTQKQQMTPGTALLI